MVAGMDGEQRSTLVTTDVQVRTRRFTPRVEQHGIGFIPDEERTSRPRNIFWIMAGSSVTFPLIIPGWIPVSLGLGWWPSFWAVVVGAIVGSFILIPMALLSPHSGTNNPVSSSPYFGVVGRIVGSMIGLVQAILFTALAVWTGGDAVAATLERLFGIPVTIGSRIFWYTIIGIAVVIVAVYGHKVMLTLQKWATPTAGGVVLLGFFVLAPQFDVNYTGAEYAFGGFWATWVAGAIPTALVVLGYGLAIGDWTRHISSKKYSDGQVARATFLGGFIGMGVPAMFGAFAATMFIDTSGDFVLELVAISPLWYVVLLFFLGLATGSAQGTVNMYSTGLDMSSIFPSITRIPGTLFVGVAAYILTIVGVFFGDVVTNLTVLLDIIVIFFVSFVTVVGIGFWNHRGKFDTWGLQSFVRREIGGRYWFTRGWNLRAVVAFTLAVAVGLTGVNTAWYQGSMVPYLGGLGIGFIVSMAVAAIVYIGLLLLFPEDLDVYVDRDPRIRGRRTTERADDVRAAEEVVTTGEE